MNSLEAIFFFLISFIISLKTLRFTFESLSHSVFLKYYFCVHVTLSLLNTKEGAFFGGEGKRFLSEVVYATCLTSH